MLLNLHTAKATLAKQKAVFDWRWGEEVFK
jgi:hypothetical protein